MSPVMTSIENISLNVVSELAYTKSVEILSLKYCASSASAEFLLYLEMRC